jgi:hypothetical protein
MSSSENTRAEETPEEDSAAPATKSALEEDAPEDSQDGSVSVPATNGCVPVYFYMY